MKKHTIVLAAASLVATTLLAGCNKGGPESCPGDGYKGKPYYGKSCDGTGHKGYSKGDYRRGDGTMMFRELDLTDEQTEKIRDTRRKNFKKGKKPKRGYYQEKFQDSFINGKFSKEKYVEVSLKRSKERAEERASMYEEIFKILTPEQTKEFIKNLK